MSDGCGILSGYGPLISGLDRRRGKRLVPNGRGKAINNAEHVLCEGPVAHVGEADVRRAVVDSCREATCKAGHGRGCAAIVLGCYLSKVLKRITESRMLLTARLQRYSDPLQYTYGQ